MLNDITIAIDVPGRGHYATTAYGLDRTIATYLPASVASLRAHLAERTELNYDEIHELSVLLIILADIDESARRMD
jgi:hypothetical protein